MDIWYECKEIGCEFKTKQINNMILHYLEKEVTEKDKETILQFIIGMIY